MKLLIIGDIFGRAGKKIIETELQNIIKKHKIDITIANAENIGNSGRGISDIDYTDLKRYGVDYITLGNHAFRDYSVKKIINNPDIIRPSNWFEQGNSNTLGKGYTFIPYQDKKILLINLLGKELMYSKTDSPFHEADRILDNHEYDLAIIDFHAETTSEKKALAYYLRDRVKVFYGTHTHIQTNDAMIMDQNQAYITDVGMTGVIDSAIGVDYESVIVKLKDNEYSIFEEKEQGLTQLSSIIVEISDLDFKPTKIDILNVRKLIK